MAWFKVDDGLHDHRKTRHVRRTHHTKRRDVSPFGLWVLAGSWAGANGTGGFVPLEVLEEWDDDAEQLAKRLVVAGLWWETEVAGEHGYGFHDWGIMNPPSEPRPTPKDASESGTFGNHVRWHVNKGKVDPDCSHCDRGESGGESPRSSGGDVGANRSRPDPSRPDPINTCASADAERERDEVETHFATWYAAYPRKKAKGQAFRAYKAALKKTDPDTLLAAIEQQGPRLTARGIEYAPYPATWLNGERWLDEDPQPALTDFPVNGTPEEKDAWARSRPMPTDGAYYGGSAR